MTVNTDINAIRAVFERGGIVDTVLPTRDDLYARMTSGQKLRCYIGFDATGPALHLGHARNIMFLEDLRKLGHEAILLFGDFTARIGDPSDKAATRKQLTTEEVNENVRLWRQQVAPLMDFDDPVNPPRVMFNNDWLSQLSFEQILDIASQFTVQHMMERDMFEKRLDAGTPIHLHEFMYPLMQGYDSVAMDVDIELCGTDQTFNALAGRTLQKRYNNREKFVIAVSLIANPKTGKLMSKSDGTGVMLNTTPHEMYGALMAQPDELCEVFLKQCTRLPIEHIDERLSDDPMKLKQFMAHSVIAFIYGTEVADAAAVAWSATFSDGGIPDDAPTIDWADELLVDVFVRENIVSSKGDFRRLLEEGAIKIVLENGDESKVADPAARLTQGAAYRIGKKRFLRVN